MKYILTIMSFCLFATVCTAEQKYHNSRWHFSFTVPDGWEITDEESKLREYTQDIKLRFEEAEIAAVCRKTGTEDKIIIQCETIGDPHQGITAEAQLEEWLRSNEYREVSLGDLKELQNKLSKEGYTEYFKQAKYIILYPPNSHILTETLVIPHKSSGLRVVSTVRALGSNRATIFNFNSHVQNSEEFLDMIKQVKESVSYDKDYGFGEAPTTTKLKVVWVWIFPGLVGVFIAFMAYGWVNR